MKPGASYARLSRTDDASEPNTDFQHKSNCDYLETLGYSIADDARYTEPVGMRSGRKIAKRPAMRQLLKDLPKYKAVAFFNFSRFSRSTEFAFEFMRAATKVGVLLYDATTRRRISADNASEFLVTVTQAGYAEYESLVGTERMVNAYKRARQNGWVYQRNPAIGLRIVGSRQDRHFEKSADFPTILKVFKLLARGHTPSEIAGEIDASVRVQGGKMVRLQEYHVHGVVGNLEMYKPFVSAETWNAARRRTRERTPTGRARPLRHPPLMLAHIATCADCGRLFTATWDRERNSNALVAVYRHSIDAICPNRHKVRARKIDARVWVVLDQLVEQLAKHNLANEVVANLDDTPARDLAAERAELEKQLRTAKDHLLHERITPADFDEFAKEVGDKLAALGKEAEPNAPLSPEDIRLISESAAGWRMMADKDPREFNLMLRDIFARIAIKRDNTLIIELAPAFRALGLAVPG